VAEMIKAKKEYYKMAEECLKSYNLIRGHIEELKNELKEIDIEDGISAVDYSKAKTSSTNKIGRVAEETAIKNITRTDLVMKQIELYTCKLNRIKEAVDSLDSREVKIIKSRYIKGKQWYIIADEENYSEKWCKKIRNTAINKLSLVLYGKKALSENKFLEAI
jgi:DNA-directed RNA polymerase specialized sigma subunit